MVDDETNSIGLLEVASIPAGVVVGDAMVKHAPVTRLIAGTIEPGRYLILVAGDEYSVRLAVDEGERVAAHHCFDALYLAQADPQLIERMGSDAIGGDGPAIGTLLASSVSAALRSADVGCKGASVTLSGLRIGDGLHGRGLVIFEGLQHEVETAIELAASAASMSGHTTETTVVAHVHPEMRAELTGSLRFNR